MSREYHCYFFPEYVCLYICRWNVVYIDLCEGTRTRCKLLPREEAKQSLKFLQAERNEKGELDIFLVDTYGPILKRYEPSTECRVGKGEIISLAEPEETWEMVRFVDDYGSSIDRIFMDGENVFIQGKGRTIEVSREMPDHRSDIEFIGEPIKSIILEFARPSIYDVLASAVEREK